MTSYRGLLNKIEAFCSAHFQIKKYAGEFKEQMSNFSTEDERFPIVYVVPTSDLSDLNTNQFSLDIYCVDIIQKDRANINTIISDCNLILNDLYLYFLDGNDLTIDVVGASAGTPINNFDLDYSAGWVKSITFEVSSYGVCAIPMNPINPNPPSVCDPATYRLLDTLDNVLASGEINSGGSVDLVVQNSTVENSDSSYTASILAEGSLVLPDITIDLVGTYGDPIFSEVVPSSVNKTITVNDSIISNSDNSYYVELPATSSLSLPDITVSVINSNDVEVDSVISPSVQDVTVVAPDGHVYIKKANDGSIINQAVASGDTVIYSVADSTINVKNSAGTTLNTTTVHATENANITLSNITFTDSDGSTSSVPVGVNITATACTAPTYNSAELTKTGQTTSYATGDDGDLEKGRGSSFFVLPYNTPFGNTNRFTSTNYLAQTTYTNNIVIDWSTYNGSTVLGYRRTELNVTTGGWANCVSTCASLSFGGFTSGWRLANLQEWNSILNIEYANPLGYVPFNTFAWTFSSHTSSSLKVAPTTYSWGINSAGYNLGKDKTENSSCLAVRTFTVSGTTLS